MLRCLTMAHCWNGKASVSSWLATAPSVRRSWRILWRALPVDLAVLPFPWVTLPKGRAFVEEVIRPRRLLVHHLPLPEDDLYGYRPATEAALSKVQVSEVWLMDRAFQEIIVA